MTLAIFKSRTDRFLRIVGEHEEVEEGDEEGESGQEVSGSEDELEDGHSTEDDYYDALPSRGDVKGKAPASPPRTPRAASPVRTKSSSWFDLDLSIIVALLSPIGNWLTGGDHVKNAFLVILLILYLHQIIESMFSLVYVSNIRFD